MNDQAGGWSRDPDDGLAACRAELAEERAYRAAIDDVLRVISESPTAVQPVFDAITERAMSLCKADMGGAMRFDGERLHLATVCGLSSEAAAAEHALFPMAPTRKSIIGRGVLERETIQIPDTLADPAFVHLGPMQEWRSGLTVPLVRQDRVLGILLVGRKNPGLFPDRLVRVLETFADQAVIAIENVRLFNEATEALEQQTAISEILRVISESPTDVQPVFDAITERAMALCDATIGAAIPFDGQHLQLATLRGLSHEATSAERACFPMAPAQNSISGRAVLERVTVQIPDTFADPHFSHLGTMQEWRSGIAVPLVREAQIFGVLTVGRRDPGLFPEKLVRLLETFADQAVIAVENVRLFNETREALEQQTATAEVLRVISSSVGDTAPVFEKILDSCERLFATDNLAIGRLHADGQLRVDAWRGKDIDVVKGHHPSMHIAIDAALNAVFTQELRTLHIPDVGALDEIPPSLREEYDRIGNFSVVMAPMLLEAQGIGVIILLRQPPRPFTEKEIALLKTFADQAVIAIENARLFHEIEDKSRELETANRHKSEFLANMSHELRTPLNAIIGFSEVLIERMFGELNEKQDDYLKDIFASGKHLLALINDILDLSKIEAGQMEIALATFDIQQALAGSLILIRERAQQHGIALELDTIGELGEIRADERKLKQIMVNLLSNAVKFTPDSGRIVVTASYTDDVLEVAVSDTGIGIAAADQETVFQEFRQVGGDYTNKHEGTGLGLALTKRFVELHGGTLTLSSEPGHGSTFTFTLPAQS